MERAKPARQRNSKPESAAETLDQIESAGDRMAAWIGANAKVVLIVAGVFLLCVAVYSIWRAERDESEQAASVALSLAQHGYRRDMGTAPNELVLAEPANPETARTVRDQYLAAFQEVASEYPGTMQSGVARIEAGDIQSAMGDTAAAQASWEAAVETTDNPVIQGLALSRLGWALEEQGAWPEAAARYRAAGDIAGNPLGLFALGDAMRAYLEADDRSQARAVALQLDRDGQVAKLPGHIRAQVAELQHLPAGSADEAH